MNFFGRIISSTLCLWESYMAIAAICFCNELNAWAWFPNGLGKLNPDGVRWAAAAFGLSVCSADEKLMGSLHSAGGIQLHSRSSGQCAPWQILFDFYQFLGCCQWPGFLTCHLENCKQAHLRHSSLRPQTMETKGVALWTNCVTHVDVHCSFWWGQLDEANSMRPTQVTDRFCTPSL